MVEVTIKQTVAGATGQRFTVAVEADATVLDLKAEIAKHCDLTVDEQRLVYKGQILKDQKALSDYGYEAGSIVHMVRSRSPDGSNARSSQPSGGPVSQEAAPAQGFPSGLQAMMNPDNPIMQALLDNPDAMRSMLDSNPVIQRLSESQPEVAQFLRNPEAMRDAMRVMSNPGLLAEQMRANDVAMRHIENVPGGYDHMRRMFSAVDSAISDAHSDAAQSSGDDALANMLRTIGVPDGVASTPGVAAGGAAQSAASPQDSAAAESSGPNAEPLPNPWSPGAAGGGAAVGMGGMGAAGLGQLASMLGVGAGGGLGGAGDMGSLSELLNGGGPLGAGNGAEPGEPGMMGMLGNPQVQQMMQQMMSNPQFMEMVSGTMSSNPNMRNLMQSNPALRAQLSNPEVMRRMMTPEVMQASLQMAQAMQTLQSSGVMPGGAAGGAPAGLPDLSSLLSSMGSFPPAAPPAENPEEAYAAQLQQLADMGFVNREANIRALQACGGNVQAAIERLL